MRKWSACAQGIRSVAAVVLLAMPAVAAAAEATLESLVESARTATEAGLWQDALALHDSAIAAYGKDEPLKKYGPQFGAMYYRKGLCELKLKKWDEAMRSFEICYRDFPNPAGGTANPFQKMALLKWGEAAMGAEDWRLAAGRFSKFLTERDKTRDVFPAGAFYINFAICHYSLGHIPTGSENLEIALKNRLNFPTPAEGIMAGFEALVQAALEKRDEQALLDFMAKNRGDLIIEGDGVYARSQGFMKLAGDAIGIGMQRAAMALYHLVPASDVVIDDLHARLKSMGAAKSVKDGSRVWDRKRLEDDLTAFEKDRAGKSPMEATKLAALAYLHEAAGNSGGAYAAYLQLERFYPGVDSREDNLFNLARLAARIGDGSRLREHAGVFIKDFPTSARLGEIQRLLLSSVYHDGDYETCIKTAGPMLGTLEQGPAHDECLYILAASHYLRGNYTLALPLLDQHVSTYPKSESALGAMYFRAMAHVRLAQPDEAALQLDQFISKFPESNPYLANALYERAALHAAAGQAKEAMATLELLSKNHPTSPLVAKGLLLKGQLESESGDLESAKKSYLAALDAAARNGGSVDAGEALLRLITLINDAEGGHAKDALPYAERFWKEFADASPWRSQIAMAQVPAFVAANRLDEASARLREAILEAAKNPTHAGLQSLVDRYAWVYLNGHRLEELSAHFATLPGTAESAALRQCISLAMIDAYENAQNKLSGNETYQEPLRDLYQHLKTDFKIQELSDEALVKLGTYLRTGTSTPREALPFYNEVAGREGSPFHHEALLGRATIASDSAVASEKDAALEDFAKVCAGSKDANERDYALFMQISLLKQKGDVEKAIELAKTYPKGGGIFTLQVKLLLADSYVESQRPAEALPLYAELSNAGNDLDISAPATLHWAQLSWTAATSAEEKHEIQSKVTAYLEATREATKDLTEDKLTAWHEIEQLGKSFALGVEIKPPAPLK